MGKVHKIGISPNKGGVVLNVDSVEAIKGKGLINDRKFKVNNDKKRQITLIEIENINYYNKISNSRIPAIKFRRNIITENIKLNDLENKEFFIGEVKVLAHDLCRPCRYLEDLLNQKIFVKELLFKGGLRCEILSNGKIYVGDDINN
tara:strand:- start:238 stop:678 length:441 start_codon:yes stop_codon:yes gene_type:complete